MTRKLTDPALSVALWSESWSKGCVDLECGITNDVSQLSEFSGNNLSTDEVDPTELGIVEKLV